MDPSTNSSVSYTGGINKSFKELNLKKFESLYDKDSRVNWLFTEKLWDITVVIFPKSRQLEEEGKHTRRYFCDEQNVSLGFYHILKSQPRWATRSILGGTW